MYLLIIMLFVYLMYHILTPARVRFNKYQEWSFSDPDGEDRGVVVIDPAWREHPDYHAPDKIRRYADPEALPARTRLVWRLAGAGVILVMLWLSSQ